MVEAKLLRKKLKNGLIVDKWDLVTIIEKQQAEIKALKAHSVKELTDRIAELENALQSIDIYLSDTLSGRAEPDPSTYKQWLIDGVIEGRNRARAILKKGK